MSAHDTAVQVAIVEATAALISKATMPLAQVPDAVKDVMKAFGEGVALAQKSYGEATKEK